MKTINDLMLHFLQDVYDAEKRGVRSLQKMARAASAETLKQAFGEHRELSQEHVVRLERVFELVTGKRPRGKTCAAMVGLTQEVDEAVEEGEKGPVLDAALIASAQAIDHYEIARYGAMVAWARADGKDEIAELLATTLAEEKASDERLNEVANGQTNEEAASVPEEQSEDDGEDEDGTDEPEPEPAPPRRAARKTPAKPAAKPVPKAAAAKPAPKAPAKRATRK